MLTPEQSSGVYDRQIKRIRHLLADNKAFCERYNREFKRIKSDPMRRSDCMEIASLVQHLELTRNELLYYLEQLRDENEAGGETC